MGKYKIEMNKAGFRELMTSGGVRSMVSEATERICSAAGDGYESDVSVRGNRVTGIVRTGTPKAYYSNRKHHTLQRLIGGG